MPTVTVLIDDTSQTIETDAGANLREALLAAGFSPYTVLTRRANCGGRGLCATCGVWVERNTPAPAHWHDRIGASFGYPRLSCQISIDADMTVRLLTDKWIWGGMHWRKRWRGG